MKRPDFHRFDLVADKDGKEAVVVKSPYLEDGKWKMIINYQSFGRYRRYVWMDSIVDTSEMTLVSKGIIGRIAIMNLSKISKPALVTGIILLVIVFLGLWTVGNYNGLVSASNTVDNSWAKVETQYQRRLDLIGNIVESVKGSQIQEQKVFKDIADGRKQYIASSGNPEGQAEAASKMETNIAVLPRLLQENYPELKSNEQVSKLITELQGTENGIASVRDRYNDVVTNYNTNITRFPKSLFAGFFNYSRRSLFKAETGAEKAPKVDFSAKTTETTTNTGNREQ